MSTATVKLWGTPIGYVSMDAEERYARFEYDPAFAEFGIEPAPLHMPVRARHIYRFESLNPRSFYGLPGLIADSLPDKYGHKLIDIWLARTGRTPDAFNSVDRLCYTGRRGMGALEFEPAMGGDTAKDKLLEIQDLIELASMAFADKKTLDTRLADGKEEQALLDILSVGTSAGGARAKAVIAFNPETRQVRSGQLDLPKGFEHWLIKFDGVAFSGDWGVADPSGYGLLEYSYYKMARACAINMMESRLFSENGRNHFMTRRFDREPGGQKTFVQTFAAAQHYDYYESGLYSYEQLFMTMRQLDMPQSAMEEQFRRVVFNLVGCNQDDHVKNFAFTMDRKGNWDLAPAYDLCHAEGSDFTRFHQLSLNGKTTGFSRDDIKGLARYAGLPRGRDKHILEQTVAVFAGWKETAEALGVPDKLRSHVQRTLRLEW
ncbi:MAG: type II toxin-antitoxin system HipA family toxin [Hyphomonas sp.]|uniref:type II toxin-antitoxin system HipA family toxin n=1 Tax=Hyphomonas sp. TaxID=87 RepID=UPI0017EA5FB4|nr:type II toxin-antitoxin system HipA family toxin [Hyphomonas sp.]MBA3069163.1 type II toxin-antitoxin system HipA family toxin [Hyphomonas sp.]MBU3921040.1 type II toxin-antitoxin system HipA family toxin [Alphaproteobacteria bacterium]MBU4062348.1 type II toxin-antitoxin system HipA family toxin [Alphaproteobacteria bacterium]MBU4162730.1 type II toxin-antitoxin system HipA family toxin [Alphaproteobacteria bacterium]